MDSTNFQRTILPFQVGLSQARRLAQGKVIKIHVSSPFPVQIDGEPFIQQPGCLEITHHGQVHHFLFSSILCHKATNSALYLFQTMKR